MGDNEFQGLSVEGSAIAAMPEDKRYCIVKELPKYEELPSFSDKTKKEKKVVAMVELSNGSTARYVINNKSCKFIAGRIGTDFAKWIGLRLTWEIRKQDVNGATKDVPYVVKAEPQSL
jgi:hypothetical protein